MIDSHCHLDRLDFDKLGLSLPEALDAARQKQVEHFLCVSVTLDQFPSMLERVQAFDDISVSCGVHPLNQDQALDKSQLLSLAQHDKVVAIGEMGLDFHYDNSPRDIQRNVFRQQIRAAVSLDKPIIIHDRDSDGETMAILDEEEAWTGRGVVYHCFTGDVATMEAIVERGGFVSIPGIVTFKNAQSMREVAAAVPMNRFFIETDSPFLAPVPYRGKRNEPARVGLVAEKIADLREMSTETVAEASWTNASQFFGIT